MLLTIYYHKFYRIFITLSNTYHGNTRRTQCCNQKFRELFQETARICYFGRGHIIILWTLRMDQMATRWDPSRWKNWICGWQDSEQWGIQKECGHSIFQRYLQGSRCLEWWQAKGYQQGYYPDLCKLARYYRWKIFRSTRFEQNWLYRLERIRTWFL